VRRLGQRTATELGEPRRNEGQVLPPLRLRDDRQDVVPQGQERSAQLKPAERAGEEPQVQVRRTVAPTVHVNPRDPVERPYGSLQPDRHHAQLRGQQVRQVTEVEVRPAFQDQDHREARGPVHRTDPPPLTHPDVRLVGGIARDAIRGILAAARRLDGDGFGELLDPHLPLEREGRPPGEVGQSRSIFGHAADPSAADAGLSCLNSAFLRGNFSARWLAPHVRREIGGPDRTRNAVVIHRSYPQARQFHVKHDVERL
jgi:hypothetical protein